MPATSTIQRFFGVVEHRLGLELKSFGERELLRLLAERSAVRRLEPAAYVERLTQGDSDEWHHLGEKLTVGETYFFRHVDQLNACCRLIQQLSAKLNGRRAVRVLSAGCSTGEEPYSIAMLLQEQGIDLSGIEIVGLDLNPGSLERARLGRYSDWSLRETPQEAVERWFYRERSGVRLTQPILDAVTFIQGNLAVPGYPLSREFDVVLCRNVLMYFSPDQFRRAASRLVEALHYDGMLVLGHAESLRGLQIDANAVHELGTFYYTRPRMSEQSTPNAISGLTVKSFSPPKELPRLAPAPSAALPDSGQGSTQLAEVDGLLRQERFTEALTLLTTLSYEGQLGAELKLRKAILLVHTNSFAAAEEILCTLLNHDNAAEAHYGLAVCHEAAARWQEASYHNRFSAYLDPTFAMPWLHLGLLSKRLGNGQAARRELLQARALLATESPERVLWFGGGCSRATLLDTCQRSLEARGEER